MSKQDHPNKRKRDSEDADEEQPYSETQEPFRSHPAFDPRVEELKRTATHHIGALLQHLAGHASVSAALRNMRVKAEKAMDIRLPDRVMIALVGDTGAGMCMLSRNVRTSAHKSQAKAPCSMLSRTSLVWPEW